MERISSSNDQEPSLRSTKSAGSCSRLHGAPPASRPRSANRRFPSCSLDQGKQRFDLRPSVSLVVLVDGAGVSIRRCMTFGARHLRIRHRRFPPSRLSDRIRFPNEPSTREQCCERISKLNARAIPIGCADIFGDFPHASHLVRVTCMADCKRVRARSVGTVPRSLAISNWTNAEMVLGACRGFFAEHPCDRVARPTATLEELKNYCTVHLFEMYR